MIWNSKNHYKRLKTLGMNKVLITGGTGFVGYWMQKTAPSNVACQFLSRADYIAAHWQATHWDYIVHLAPVSPYAVTSQAAKDNARLLYCSSGIVYHPENNIEYRRDKMNWEQHCLESGVDVVIARLFAFYGEGLDEHKAYTQFTKAAMTGQPIIVQGDGNVVRSYMHGSEMGEWLWAILLKGKSGEAYDVGSDEPITMLQLAKFIKSQKRSMSEIVVKGGTSPMPHYLPADTAKTKALL